MSKVITKLINRLAIASTIIKLDDLAREVEQEEDLYAKEN